MADQSSLARQVRSLLGQPAGLTEKPMFGCIAFFMNGNLAVGVRGDELIVRLAPAEASGALAESGVRVFDPTGRPMKGWVVVGASALKTPKSIAHWVQRGVSYASSLPKK